jgi:hypothetical protein
MEHRHRFMGDNAGREPPEPPPHSRKSAFAEMERKKNEEADAIARNKAVIQAEEDAAEAAKQAAWEARRAEAVESVRQEKEAAAAVAAEAAEKKAAVDAEWVTGAEDRAKAKAAKAEAKAAKAAKIAANKIS